MKNNILYILMALSVTTFSCQQKTEQYTKSVEDKVKRVEQSAKDGSWLQKLIVTEPHSEAVLLSKLPKQLAGLPLRGSASSAPQTATGTYSLNPEPNHETENITLTIMDGAGNYGFGHLNAIHKMISLEVNNNGNNGWAKTQEHKGVRILIKEEIDTDVLLSQLEYIKNNRYHITLSGRRYDSKKLLQAKEDLEKIKF